MTKLLILVAPFAALAFAQQSLAPTPDPVGPAKGEAKGNYNVVQSWELGYRFAEVGGNRGEYRSDVNYGNGVRLLGSSLSIHSKNGRDRWFDEIVLTTQGLGNDPYESATARVRKNRVYEYDLTWRQNDYFNPGLVVANGEHFRNTQYRWQDHDLTIFPERPYKLLFGYGRSTEAGPGLSTQQFFDGRGDAIPFFANIKREFNTYRLGGEFEFHKFRLHLLRRWEFYKEDTPYFLLNAGRGDNPLDPTTLTQFTRAEPYHGQTPGWLVNLFTERRWFALNGRFTYAGGRRDFVLNESAMGTDRFQNNQERQVIVAGNARRPVTTGDASLSIFATQKLTLVNNSSFANTRIDGNNFFQQFDNQTQSGSVLNFQFLGIRLFTNSTDARYRFNRKFSAYTGYHFSTRLIRSIEDTATPGSLFEGITAQQNNHLHAGVAGFNWNPVRPLRLRAEAEIGRNDNPFTIVSERNYHAISARAEYRRRDIQLSAAYRQNYNNNSVTLSSYSSRARNYSANASWAARKGIALDASYARLHLDTLGGIAFFAGSPRPQLVADRESLYISNIHSGTLGVRFGIAKRADLFVGYNITRDVGDGRGRAITPGNAVDALLYSVQTFPLTYQSPLVRASYRWSEKIRFNLGYQYYGYKEQFGLFSVNDNYRANTGLASILWSF
ncbi:MAG: hypothetical protein M3Z09_17315 [Acidobacteriota bacterium]|nr:hypothetical protein [Acidobacteriota bacterium]